MPDGENSCPARSVRENPMAQPFSTFNIDSFHYKKQTIKKEEI